MDKRPTLCVDFDGCIHANDNGWQNGDLYGGVIPGFFEWFMEAQNNFRIVIYSVRCSDENLLQKMAEWFIVEYDKWANTAGLSDEPRPVIEFSDVKIPAVAYIDDRAIRFEGNWQEAQLSVQSIMDFKPWNIVYPEA